MRVVVVVRKFGVNSGSRFIWKIEPGCRFSWEMWQNQRWREKPEVEPNETRGKIGVNERFFRENQRCEPSWADTRIQGA